MPTGVFSTGKPASIVKRVLRFLLADCFCTAHAVDFTDGVLKTTLTFKGPAIDKAAAGNMKWESILKTTAAALDAPTAYTPGSVKW